MADSSNTLPLISASQSSKEVTANALFTAGSPALLFGIDTRTTAALTLGYLGGKYRKADGTVITIANGTQALTASATNYILETDGVVSKVTAAPSGWPGPLASNAKALYAVVCDGSGPTSYTDYRTTGVGSGAGSGAVTSVNITAPAAGITASGGPITTSGAITLALANDLAALEGVSGTGVPERTGTDTWSLRTLDTDTALAANSDTRIATQKAVKAYVDGAITGGAADVMIFKGVINCSTNPNYPAADAGNLYKVSVAGKIGGASGASVEIGDTLYCIADGIGSDTQANVGQYWAIVQANIGTTNTFTGDVTGTGTVGASMGLTVANDAVTYAKMQNVSAASKLLGRGDSSSGDPQEITLGTGLSMTGTTLSASSSGSSNADVQAFTAGGTWTKPAGCLWVEVTCISGGGGGGGGSGSAAGTFRTGGTGGGGGCRVTKTFRASDLGSTVAVTVGAGGTSGAGGSSGGGSNGGAGGTSTFGAHLSAFGGGGGIGASTNLSATYLGAGGGGSGGQGAQGNTAPVLGGAPTTSNLNPGIGGGGASNASATVAGQPAEYGGGAGGHSRTNGAAFAGGTSIHGSGGGGGGGSLWTDNTSVSAAAAGGGVNIWDTLGAGGGAAGTGSGGNAGTAGTAGDTTKGGTGGGGGATNSGGTGGAGGAGGACGGGAGGGGGGTSTGGAGGVGGRGEVRVTAW